MIMKAFLAISCLLATAFADEAYVKTHLTGHWKENQYQRNGLNNFLYEMGKGVIQKLSALCNHHSMIPLLARFSRIKIIIVVLPPLSAKFTYTISGWPFSDLIVTSKIIRALLG